MKNVMPLIAAGAMAAFAATATADVAPDAVSIVDMEVAGSLTGVPGDPAAGRNWAKDRKLGNCLACHQNSDMSEEQFHGEVGPPLDGVGSRWTEAQLRAILVNSKMVFGEQTIMPGFYRIAGFNRTLDAFEGKPILEAQQVEDVIAYLLTLTE